jgi:hypothetical protein
MSDGARAPRAAVSDTKGCEDCEHCRPSMLFTLCQHDQAKYTYDGREEFHTIQHMRDTFVGLCGSAMKLRKMSAATKPSGDGRKWDRSVLA